MAEAARQRAAEYLEVTRQKQVRGLASSIDLLRAQAQEAQARLGLLEAEQDLVVGMETFKATAGLGRNAVVVPTESLAAPAEFVEGEGGPEDGVAGEGQLHLGREDAQAAAGDRQVTTALGAVGEFAHGGYPAVTDRRL